MSTAVRRDYFALLLAQDVGYHDIKNSGELNTKLVSDTALIEKGIGPKYGFYIQQFCSFIVGVFFAFYYSWEMSLILLATLPALIIVGVVQGWLMAGTDLQNADPFVSAGGFSNEVLTHIRTVVAYPSMLKSKAEEFLDVLDKAFPIARKRALVIGFSAGSMQLAMFGVVYTVGLWYGCHLVDKGDITVGKMFGCFFGFAIGGMALGQLTSVLPDIAKAKIASNSFYSLQERVPAIKRPDGGKPIKTEKGQRLKGAIEFENVSFAYPADRKKVVLENVSFSIKPGQNFAIVGPSGSGKSTIVNLIERFYDPIAGSIQTDGEEIHNYDMSFLRSQIGYVSQLPLLFEASIEENVRGGNADITLDMVMEACKMADAHDFIS